MARVTIQEWIDRDPELLADQRKGYDRMREAQPLAEGRWGVTALRYDDVLAICRDAEKFSNEKAWAAIDFNQKKDELSIPLAMDPPEHRQYRMLLRNIFESSRVAAYEETARRIAIEHIERMIDAGQADVVADFSDPYPVKSLCGYIGWDMSMAMEIKRWSREFTELRVAGRTDEAMELFNRWRSYIREVVEARRIEPQEDVTSWLVEVSEDGKVLNIEQIISILRLLLMAGHGTTTTALGNMTEYLARNPDQQQRLREDRSLLPSAIEEMLRYDSPQLAMPRRTMCPVTIGGIDIAEDQNVWVNFLAANRDPRMFDNADVCVFERRPNRHIAFGSGIHACLGAPFARMEIRVALNELLDRTSNFYLTTGEVPPRVGFPHNQPTELDVKFDR